jgi:N-acetylmuramoyl-L-alanine amidase
MSESLPSSTTAARTGRAAQLARAASWLALALILVLPFPSPAAASPRSKATAAYQRALRLRAQLESRPQHARPAGDYLELIRAFQDVYQLDPTYEKSPEALADAAQLREEMGWEFADKHYYADSIQAYEFLMTQYPGTPVARDALFTIAEIYRVDLSEPDQARRVFRKLVAENPDSAKSRLAREKLRQIEQAEAAERRRSPVAEEAPQAASPSGREEPESESGGSSGETASRERTTRDPALVTGIRFWVGSNYTRVIIALQGEAKFTASRLSHPDRLVFDLPDSRLSRALAGKTFPVEDGFLRQVRIAQYQPTVTRAVLDVKKITDYSVFSLPNPFRLVIDIHGTPTESAEKLENPQARMQGPATAATLDDVRGQGANSPRLREPARRAAGSATPGSRDSGRASQIAAARAPKVMPVEDIPTEQIVEVTAPPAAVPPATEDEAAGATAQGPGSSSPSASAHPTVPASRTSTPDSGRRVALNASREPSENAAVHSKTLTRVLGLKIGRIVIDPGHGGHDTGTIGPHGLREKDLVLDVGLRLKALLERKTDAEVVMTRSDDTFIPLEERTAIANQKAADLFVSIHANASRDSSARGIETYYLNFTSDPHALEVAARENASSTESIHELQGLVRKIVLTEKITESRDLAADVQRSVYSTLVKAGAREEDRGVKRAPFVVLIGANMPSILAEISFVTNPRDERLLKRPEYRQRIAEALYRGIQQYTRNLGGLRVAEREQSEPGTHPGSRSASEPPLRTAQSIPGGMK